MASSDATKPNAVQKEYNLSALNALSTETRKNIDTLAAHGASVLESVLAKAERLRLADGASCMLFIDYLAGSVERHKDTTIIRSLADGLDCGDHYAAINATVLFTMVIDNAKTMYFRDTFAKRLGELADDSKRAMFCENVLHLLLQRARSLPEASKWTVEVEVADLFTDILGPSLESGLFDRKHNPPLIFAPDVFSNDGFSADYAKGEIDDPNATRLIELFTDELSSKLIAWSLLRLRRHLGDSESGRDYFRMIVQGIANSTTLYFKDDDNEVMPAPVLDVIWAAASVASATKDGPTAYAAYTMLRRFANDIGQMRLLSHLAQQFASMERDKKALREIFERLGSLPRPEEALKEAYELRSHYSKLPGLKRLAR